MKAYRRRGAMVLLWSLALLLLLGATAAAPLVSLSIINLISVPMPY
jgi:hypothetical protein